MRRSILVAFVIWGAMIAVSTELLSLCNLITYGAISAMWVVASLGFLGWAIVTASRIGGRQQLAVEFKFTPWMVAIGVAVLYIVITIILGLVCPPNNWDSMTYHLPRVCHWIQNESVRFYPTAIERQLWQPPMAEYAILHLMLLSGSDMTANLVQALAMIVSCLGVTLIVARLGGGKTQQILAFILTATIPVAILQASTTQNDLICAAWLVCFILFSLEIMGNGAGVANVALCGVSAGLAVLTKGIAGMYLIAPVIWLAVVLIKKMRGKAAIPLAAVMLLAIVMTAGHFARNLSFYHSLAASPKIRSEFMLAHPSAGTTYSNLLRNFAMHLGISQGINAATTGTVEKLDGMFGIDANDPDSTIKGQKFWIFASLHEDFSGNLVHMILGLAAIIMLFASSSLRRNRPLLMLGICVLAGFLIYCATTKWQPWASRLHLPLFVLGTPIIAMAFGRWVKVCVVMTVIVLASAIPWAMMNSLKPIFGQYNVFKIPHEARYFMSNPAFYSFYTEGCGLMARGKFKNIGLVIGGDNYEYPFWTLLKDAGLNPRIEHVAVKNDTNKLSYDNSDSEQRFHPEVVFMINTDKRTPAGLKLGDEIYGVAFKSRQFANNQTGTSLQTIIFARQDILSAMAKAAGATSAPTSTSSPASAPAAGDSNHDH